MERKKRKFFDRIEHSLKDDKSSIQPFIKSETNDSKLNLSKNLPLFMQTPNLHSHERLDIRHDGGGLSFLFRSNEDVRSNKRQKLSHDIEDNFKGNNYDDKFSEEEKSNFFIHDTAEISNDSTFSKSQEQNSNENNEEIEFDILDEFESTGNECDERYTDSDSDISQNEIDELLEAGIDYVKDLDHEEKEKVILKVRGRDLFELLPEGWIEVTHNSGMPIYLHKQSRVCTVSKPYFLGPGSTRKHEIPISAIPCLHYLREIEKEKMANSFENAEMASNFENAKMVNSFENAKMANNFEIAKTSNDIKNEKISNDIKNGKLSDIKNDKMSNVIKNEKMSGDIKNEKTSGDIKNGKISGDIKYEKISSDDKNEKIFSDIENKKMSEDMKNKTLSCDIKNEKMSSDIKNEKTFSDFKNEKISEDSKNENISEDSKNKKISEDSIDEKMFNNIEKPQIFNTEKGQISNNTEKELSKNLEKVIQKSFSEEDKTNIVFPSAKLECIKDIKESYYLDYMAVREYCKRRFEFQTITVKRFKTWSGRRKHQKLMKQRQRPTLPDNTKLITCSLPPPTRKDTSTGNSKKEFIINPSGKSPVCILHEYVQHTMRVQPRYIYKELENASTPYGAVVMIKDIEYGSGYGSSKKQAKSEAAKVALEILIPKMKMFIPDDKEEELRNVEFFDEIRVEDPRVCELSIKAGQPYPYQILLECLKRNYGMGDTEMDFKMLNLKHQKNKFYMRVGKHEVTVLCKNKRDGKHRASQAILQRLHPHITSWGSLLRMYGKGSCKTLKEKKEEEQKITELQTKACANRPNMSILNKLKEEMLKYRERMGSQKPIGKLIPGKMEFFSPSNLSKEC